MLLLNYPKSLPLGSGNSYSHTPVSPAMRRKAPSVPFTESKPFKKGLQVTLTPLQPAAADFPGPELHTTCPVHFPKHHHLIGGNEHVLMASSFKSSTHFDSIENTIFVLLLFFCFASI